MSRARSVRTATARGLNAPRGRRRGPVAAALVATLVAAPVAGQSVFRDLAPTSPDGPAFAEAPLDVGERYVVIRLEENRLYVMEGRHIVWSAPVATGTGFRLDGGSEGWTFSTPRGVFQVQRREIDPVWIMPDWAFVERGLPVPPEDAPSRRRRGMLGHTALYIGYELAIHGTDRPELVLREDPDARRVSHGCIRMTDQHARELYHMVDVGTLVLIY